MMRKAGRSRASLHARRVLAILVPIMGLVGGPGRSVASSSGGRDAGGAGGRLAAPAGAVDGRLADRGQAPEGWTHLVIKSIPELQVGRPGQPADVANKTATMFHTVMLADVQPLGLDKQFILSRVGLAMCVPAKDGTNDDVVVSSDRLEALSIKLSTVEQMVLEAAEAELAESRIIAFTSTFALLRSPAMLVVDGKHQKVDLYYAFCVDPATGRLRVGAWSMWPGDVQAAAAALGDRGGAEDDLPVRGGRPGQAGAGRRPLLLDVRDAEAAARPVARDQGEQAAGREDRGDRPAPHRRQHRGIRADSGALPSGAPPPTEASTGCLAADGRAGLRWRYAQWIQEHI